MQQQTKSIKRINSSEQQDFIKINKNLYNFKPSAFLTFDKFFSSLKIQQQQLPNLIEINTFDEVNSNQTQFIGVQIEQKLKIYKWKKQQKENKWKKIKFLVQNPLGTQMFQILEERIKSNIKDNETNNIEETNNEKITSVQQNESFFQFEIDNCPDLLVSDIYGPNSSSIGLPPNMLASCFGKLTTTQASNFLKKQLLRSLVLSLAINCAQITGLAAKKHGVINIMVLNNSLGQRNFSRIFYTILGIYFPEKKVYFFQN